MLKSCRPQSSAPLRRLSGAIVSLAILLAPITVPVTVLAHGGHGDEFQGGESEASQTTDSIPVDAETAKRLGIKVEPVNRQRLAVGLKTTGQIETLPNKQVEVTTPISGAKVAQLLVQPGASVQAGQPVAVISTPDLVELRVTSQEKQAEARADLQKAQADLRLAQQNYQRFSQIAAAEIAQAQSQVDFAQEKSDKDQVLLTKGAIPRRQALESQTQLAEAKAKLTAANSRRDVIAAEADLKRAQSSVQVAQSRLNLSDTAYQTRLQQLGAKANAQGLVTVTAPISGRVADREVTIGQSFQDAGGKLMTIVNDSRVYATANIYEKDLDKVKKGQPVKVTVASMPDRTFTGRITVIGSVVEGETRVVPVKAEIENSSGVLKPGMFAQLEVLTDRTSTALLAIPSSAVVEANGKQMVYIQNGNAYQPAEVMLGQTSGDMVEVKSGLFEGDEIVTQRAPQLYAQSLRGGSKEVPAESAGGAEAPKASNEGTTPSATTAGVQFPWWLTGAVGGLAIGTAAFAAGAFWSGRRTKSQLVPASTGPAYEEPAYEPHEYPNGNGSTKSTTYYASKGGDRVESVSGDESSSMNDNYHTKSQQSEVRDRQ
ncbi:efflux RND transporter periplasmic adaptor subunit [Chroococcidiopsis sp. FACHB-1243]|uniref:efflux RND transporter periplasmic adaptor subunit n=1 Tax=Chroococcidiopsis sp. [FACHB-1243] TaxID=2692781 RepID=UPI0017845652|nr:efflux RND transporter periplasmic adaptor subunit [Chroococcidiopsis sp. [FACHB-1243]]MBD2307274.1 efflux RND transporter periplasmic adaptor subunit [Chroococcidiopsis sp. [FACHB-1243]]